jgi:hypothetical protein
MENLIPWHLRGNHLPNLMRLPLLLALAALLTFPLNAQNSFYSKRWSDVYKHEVRDLPQSALKIVDTIY